MFSRALWRMRDLIRTGRYIMTTHGIEEMEADGLCRLDIERCILSGTIIERQKDRESGEWKYLISGPAVETTEIVVVAKFGSAGRLVVITVYFA